MAKYSADIEIAVRGGQQVDGLIKNLSRLNNSINVVNRNAKLLEGKGFNVANMENYSRAVFKAENALRKAAQGTRQEEMAVRSLVTAMDAENKARSRRNFLIAQEVASRRQVIATANAGFGMQGPQAAAIRAARGPASPIRGTVNMPGSPAALAAVGGTRSTSGGRGISSRLGGAISGSIIGGAFPLLFGQGGGAAAGGAIGGLVGGLAGPGGSFAGSLLGTLLGDIASRGQAVKQLADDIGFSAQQTKQLSDAFKVANTDVEKFTAVIQNIRGIGLELEDQAKAIQLVTRLTEVYGGSFEKTGNAITSALESGKVNQATLNQLTSQGINVQQALADKYGVSRSELLKMAKDGDISVQTLIDTLVKMGNEGVVAVDKPKSAMDRLKASVNDLGKNLSNLANALVKSFGPVLQWLTDRVTDFVSAVSRAIARMADLINGGRMAQAEIQASTRAQAATREKFGVLGGIRAFNPAAEKFFQQQRELELRRLTPGAFAQPGARTPLQSFTVPSQAAPSGGAGAKGPKPPEDRTAQLLEDLEAMKLISTTQDGIRDALFEGNKELAIRLEYDQKIADINRDTAKALLNANYESEKAVIRAQEIVRIKDAQLDRDDQLRTLARDIRTAYEETFRSLQEGVDWSKGFTFPDTVREFIKEARKDLSDLQDTALTVSQGIGAAIGDTFTNGLTSLISGAATVKSVFADLLQSVGQILAQEGAKMIATYIAIGIAKMFAGLGGKNIFEGPMSPDTLGTLSVPGLGGAGALGTGLPISPSGVGGAIPGFANGGFATANKPAVVGEKGPELFIPRTGGSVVPAQDLRAAMSTSSGSAGAPVLNMSFETTNIGGVEYVSRDQLEAAMAATRRDAARDGARQGMSMTLDKLQQSPGTRGRVGLR